MPQNSITSQAIDSYDLHQRLAALSDTIRNTKLDSNGGISHAAGLVNHASGLINMHIHSFYSYNSRGYSPAHIALACRQQGLSAAALCDFDVLDGLEEFIHAGQMLGLKTAVHIETRAFMKEYSQTDINSPGEPGVTYILGAGFGRLPDPKSSARQRLNEFRRQANMRNEKLVERINARLPAIAIDYNADVLPLSPGSCPTERHIVEAYRLQASKNFRSKIDLVNYWSALLNQSADCIEKYLTAPSLMEEKIRVVLVKSGGIGYIRPTATTFPPLDDFMAWVLECNAIPMVGWLDGTSGAEKNISQLLECMQAKGAAALNIIPDRNHNIKDKEERRLKIKKLEEIVGICRKMMLPINIGTEMNRSGQPFVDDLNCEALAPYKADFLRGANIMVGQTVLVRYAAYGYCGQAVKNEFGNDIEKKNNFFEAVGRLPPVNQALADKLENMGFEKAYQFLRDSAVKEVKRYD
jgi:hypothetical protein